MFVEGLRQGIKAFGWLMGCGGCLGLLVGLASFVGWCLSDKRDRDPDGPEVEHEQEDE